MKKRRYIKKVKQLEKLILKELRLILKHSSINIVNMFMGNLDFNSVSENIGIELNIFLDVDNTEVDITYQFKNCELHGIMCDGRIIQNEAVIKQLGEKINVFINQKFRWK